MKDRIGALIVKLYTRKCRGGCGGMYEFGFHTHHFTWLGRLRYTGKITR